MYHTKLSKPSQQSGITLMSPPQSSSTCNPSAGGSRPLTPSSEAVTRLHSRDQRARDREQLELTSQ